MTGNGSRVVVVVVARWWHCRAGAINPTKMGTGSRAARGIVHAPYPRRIQSFSSFLLSKSYVNPCKYWAENTVIHAGIVVFRCKILRKPLICLILCR